MDKPIGKDYTVLWEIDVVASSPREAALLARRHQTRTGTTAVVFEVVDDITGDLTRVDLLEPDGLSSSGKE